MADSVDSAPPDDSWEAPKAVPTIPPPASVPAAPPRAPKPSINTLAVLIEVTPSPVRVSDLPPPTAVAGGAPEVMPTLPPPAALPLLDLATIETVPPGDYEQERVLEIMPSNLPEPSRSRLPPPAATAIAPAAVSAPAAALVPSAAPAPDAMPSMATIEALVSQNQWTKVCELLGAPEHQGRLPVGMAFIYAVALNELRVPGSVVDKRAPDIEKIMQRCLSVMLGADSKGPLAQIISKRLMRRSWRGTPAPPTRTSVLLVLAALAVGSFIGFLLGPGHDWFKNM